MTGRFLWLERAGMVVSPVRHRVENCLAQVGEQRRGRVKVVESAGGIQRVVAIAGQGALC